MLISLTRRSASPAFVHVNGSPTRPIFSRKSSTAQDSMECLTFFFCRHSSWKERKLGSKRFDRYSFFFFINYTMVFLQTRDVNKRENLYEEKSSYNIVKSNEIRVVSCFAARSRCAFELSRFTMALLLLLLSTCRLKCLITPCKASSRETR